LYFYASLCSPRIDGFYQRRKFDKALHQLPLYSLNRISAPRRRCGRRLPRRYWAPVFSRGNRAFRGFGFSSVCLGFSNLSSLRGVGNDRSPAPSAIAEAPADKSSPRRFGAGRAIIFALFASFMVFPLSPMPNGLQQRFFSVPGACFGVLSFAGSQRWPMRYSASPFPMRARRLRFPLIERNSAGAFVFLIWSPRGLFLRAAILR